MKSADGNTAIAASCRADPVHAGRGDLKRRFLPTAAAMLLGTASASAAGFDLGWNDCPGGPTYDFTRTFACDTNLGVNTLVVSYVAPANVLAVSANEVVIDMQTESSPFSPWWSLRTSAPAGCRPSSMTQSPDFTAGPFTCYDYWQGGASAGVSMDFPSGNRTKIKALAAVPAGSPLITSVPEGTPVYTIKINISNTRTVGLGACAGCTEEACLVLNTIRLNQPVGPPADGISITLTNPATAQHVTWQGWSTTDPVQQCPLVTPARSRTWGSIKAIYR